MLNWTTCNKITMYLMNVDWQLKVRCYFTSRNFTECILSDRQKNVRKYFRTTVFVNLWRLGNCTDVTEHSHNSSEYRGVTQENIKKNELARSSVHRYQRSEVNLEGPFISLFEFSTGQLSVACLKPSLGKANKNTLLPSIIFKSIHLRVTVPQKPRFSPVVFCDIAYFESGLGRQRLFCVAVVCSCFCLCLCPTLLALEIKLIVICFNSIQKFTQWLQRELQVWRS